MVSTVAHRRSLRKGVLVTEPLDYLEFLPLNQNASMVTIDGGSLQEEVAVPNVPCITGITLRHNKERSFTIKQGKNVLAGNYKNSILACASLTSGMAKPRNASWSG